MTRFPNPVVSPAAAPHQHRFEAGPPPPSTFHPQPVVAASIQGAASGQGGGNQGGNQGGGNQARHDEALRQNALHRQMLAEVEERHREATLQVKWRILLRKNVKLEMEKFVENIAKGTTDPEIDSVTWIKFSNNMDFLHLLQILPLDGATCNS